MTAKLDPNTTHRTCCRCKVSKKLEDFPRASGKALGRHYCCRMCRRAYDRNRKPRRLRGPADRQLTTLTPLPYMSLADQLEALRLRKWRGPVTPGQLLPTLGMPVMGREAA